MKKGGAGVKPGGILALTFLSLAYSLAFASTAVSTQNASSITHNSATLNGAIGTSYDGAFTVTFEYDTSVDFDFSPAAGAAVEDGGTYSLDIASLNSATQYFFRIKVIDESAAYVGSTLAFYTLSSAPATTIANEQGALVHTEHHHS